MSRFRIDDFDMLETSPTSASALRFKLGEMLLSSTSARVKVENANTKTGEYRIVVQGTLDLEKLPFEEE